MPVRFFLDQMEANMTVNNFLQHIAQRYLPQSQPQTNAPGVSPSADHDGGANPLPQPPSATPTHLPTFPMPPENNFSGSSSLLPA